MATLDYQSAADYNIGVRDGVETGTSHKPSGADTNAYNDGFSFGDYLRQFLHPAYDGVQHTYLG